MKQTKPLASGFPVDEVIETLRQQLAIERECIEQYRIGCLDGNRQLADMTAQFDAAKAGCETEANAATQLRRQLAEKDAEILKLNQMYPATAYTVEIEKQLAASQAREQKLREALEAVHAVSLQSHGIDGWHLNGEIATWDELLPEVAEALALPTDDITLSEMIAKAGEVMRRQSICIIENAKAFSDVDLTLRRSQNEIRALPGVTMEDLQE